MKRMKTNNPNNLQKRFKRMRKLENLTMRDTKKDDL